MKKIIYSFLMAAAFAATVNTTEGMKHPSERQFTSEETNHIGEIVGLLTGVYNMPEDQLFDIVLNNFDRVKSWIATLPSYSQKPEEENAWILIAGGVPFGDEFMQATPGFRLEMTLALFGISISTVSSGDNLQPVAQRTQEKCLSIGAVSSSGDNLQLIARKTQENCASIDVVSSNGDNLQRLIARKTQENCLSIDVTDHVNLCNLPLACRALESNVPFHTMKFRGIGEKEARPISESLRTNTTLTSLNMSGNSIGDEGARAVSEPLRTNTTLTSLNMKYNGIGAEGARAISESLRTNTSLTSLNMRLNHIGAEGSRLISDALRHNSTLTSLNIGWNNIRDEGARAISESLMRNPTLTSLDMEYNAIGDEGARAFSESLRTNTSLMSLNIGLNRIGAGARLISESLMHNSTLTELNLRDNPGTGFDGEPLSGWRCSIQ